MKNGKRRLLICLFVFWCVLLTACQNDNINGDKPVADGISNSDEPRDLSGTEDVADIKNLKLFRNINYLLMRFMPSYSWDETEEYPRDCAETEMTWSEMLEKYGESNTYVITDAFALHGVVFTNVDVSSYSSDSTVVIASRAQIRDYVFLGDPLTNKVLGYVKTRPDAPSLFGNDIATAKTMNQEPSYKWSGTDISDTLFEEVSGSYLFAGGAGNWRNLLVIGDNGNINGTYTERTDTTYGTIYSKCEYSGLSVDVKKISDFVYSVNVDNLTYPETGKEYEDGGFSYITCSPRGLEDVNELRIFLPGCHKDEIPENVLFSACGAMDLNNLVFRDRLVTFVIFSVSGNSGFVFWE